MRMIIVCLFFLLPFTALGKGYNFRVTQGIDEAQKAVKKAYDIEADEKAPYLYSYGRNLSVV